MSQEEDKKKKRKKKVDSQYLEKMIDQVILRLSKPQHVNKKKRKIPINDSPPKKRLLHEESIRFTSFNKKDIEQFWNPPKKKKKIKK
jgi:hypothetical protein